MIIVYTPEGGEPETLDARRLRASEVMAIEKAADMKWAEVRQGLHEGDVTAVRTVAWALKRRNEPALRLAQFDPFDDELIVRLDAREVESFALQVYASFRDQPEELAAAWDELREAAHDKDACELAIKQAEELPKDPGPVPPSLVTDGSPTAA
ncbi:hypothetical protein V2W30_22685 [Streptomyces sp. Q6]|uniref:Uncharacterized protein n=1 Tax=Streptomyces citrinus TaxID=3118173 RepID=A0ACD5AF63_9ACTN